MPVRLPLLPCRTDAGARHVPAMGVRRPMGPGMSSRVRSRVVSGGSSGGGAWGGWDLERCRGVRLVLLQLRKRSGGGDRSVCGHA